MRFLTTMMALTVLMLTGIGAAKEAALLNFTMQDQFDQEYTQDSFNGKVIILLGADREGSEYTDTWGAALGDSLKARGVRGDVQFVALANLAGVPDMMKKMIKGFFPKENRVLTDWDGVFATAYDFIPGKCNILVFDKEKNLAAHEPVTEYDAATAGKILNAIGLQKYKVCSNKDKITR